LIWSHAGGERHRPAGSTMCRHELHVTNLSHNPPECKINEH
jgi:hypothetical protein